MQKILYILLVFLVLMGCEETKRKPYIPPYDGNLTQLTFTNIQHKLEKPSKVKYFFSLRDQDNHAVVIPKRSLKDVKIDVYEDTLLVDSSETPPILHLGSDAKMDIMLVMDFTESMVKSGSLTTMIDGAISILHTLSDNHRVAILEFHDSNPESNYSLISDFTYDKQAVEQALKDFQKAGAYHGFSQCWDAVLSGLNMFTAPTNHEKVNALVFLSDGHNVNSSVLPSQLIKVATQNEVRLYTIGAGSTSAEDALVLNQLSSKTGGEYYLAPNDTFLDEKFKLIIADLGGNYTLSYTTPSKTTFASKINLTWLDVTTENSLTADFDISPYVENDKIGLLEISTPVVNTESIDFNISAKHIPRGINSFSFAFDVTHDADITFNSMGGLIEDWNAPVKQSSGFYFTGGTELNFGDYGFITSVSIAKSPDISPENLNVGIGVYIDNGIYDYDVKFVTEDGQEYTEGIFNYFKQYFVIGTQALNPSPRNLSKVNYSLLTESKIPFSWQVLNSRAVWKAAVLIDSLPVDSTFVTPKTTVASELVNTRFNYEIKKPKAGGTEYFWRIKLTDNDSNEILGPIWKFELYNEDFN